MELRALRTTNEAMWAAAGCLVATFLGAVVALADMSSGTVSARLQDGSGTKLTSTGGMLDVNCPSCAGAGGGGLTDVQLRASPIAVSGTLGVTGTFWQATQPISGSVSVLNFPASQLVTGTFWQGTQPVSGTFWQATQPVSGTFWQATQPISGSVSVSNFPASQAVTGTFFQVTQPVSIASMPSTPVTGTFWQSTQPVSGTFWQSTQPVSISSMPSTPVTGTFFQTTQPVSQAGPPWTVVIPDGYESTLGSKADAPASDLGPASAIALLKALNVDLIALTTLLNGVSVKNFPSTQPVTVGNFPAVQPVQVQTAGLPQPPCNIIRRTQCVPNHYSLSGF